MHSKNNIYKTDTEFSIKQSFLAFASKKLTNKEKEVIIILSKEEVQKNATQTVKIISSKMKIPESTSWFIIRKLISFGIIEKDSEDKLCLSKAAQILIEEGV